MPDQAHLNRMVSLDIVQLIAGTAILYHIAIKQPLIDPEARIGCCPKRQAAAGINNLWYCRRNRSVRARRWRDGELLNRGLLCQMNT